MRNKFQPTLSTLLIWSILSANTVAALGVIPTKEELPVNITIWTQQDVDNATAEELAKIFSSKESLDMVIDDMGDSVNQIWIITAAINIIAMQLGFSFLEVGSIHPKNKANILIKNLLDTFIGALAFYALGFAFANDGGGGLVGGGQFFCRGLTRDDMLKWLF